MDKKIKILLKIYLPLFFLTVFWILFFAFCSFKELNGKAEKEKISETVFENNKEVVVSCETDVDDANKHYENEEDFFPKLMFIGNFEIAHYCSCSICCGEWSDGFTASGTVATEGRTIAVDPNVIPIGSEVALFYDDGRICYYFAEDTGSAIKGNKVDVFIADHERANNLGITGASVYIVNS